MSLAPAPKMTRPLLARLSGADADASRRLHRGRAPLTFAVGEHRLTLVPASARELAIADNSQAQLIVRGGAGPALLGLSRPLVRLLLGPAIPETHPDLDLLAEMALTVPLAALERILGHSLSLHPAGERLPPDLGLVGFRVFQGDSLLGLATLRLAARDLAAVVAALDRLPPQPSRLDALPLSVIVDAGSIRLTLDTVRGLSRGDVLLSDDGHAPGTAAITIADRRRLIGRKAETGFQIIADGNRRGLTPMDDADKASAETIDDLEVRIVFEIGRRDLPLSELQRIRPGYVVELDRPLGLSVDLTVRGQMIGKGELVQIDNTIGVRIQRLFGHE
jgi:type III secretion protein Q